MPFSDSLLMLAGFVFAHATWSISDLPKDELLVPLAIVESSGQRELLRFVADTQAQAVAEGKATLEKRQDATAWAFAREGQLKENGAYVDVLTVEAKSNETKEAVVFVQRFQPFSKGRFKLIGEPIVSIGGRELSSKEAAPILRVLYAGVHSHARAAESWAKWSAQ